MDLARYVVDAVVLEGRFFREVAVAHGVSKSYVGKLAGRLREGGYEACAPVQGGAPERHVTLLDDGSGSPVIPLHAG